MGPIKNRETLLFEVVADLVREAQALRVLDLHDTMGVDFQAQVPRLGGWILLANSRSRA